MQDDNPLSALSHLGRPHTQRLHPDTALLLGAGTELIIEGMAQRTDGRKAPKTARPRVATLGRTSPVQWNDASASTTASSASPAS